MTTAFAFDLDGTITREELLPIFARLIGLEREIRSLTRLTLQGQIDFEDSFRLRCAILSKIHVAAVHQALHSVRVFEKTVDFIRERQDQCFIVTGNLDAWIAPLRARLGCDFFCSTATVENGQVTGVSHVLRKSEAIETLRANFSRIVTVGDSVNDLPMFEVSDIRIAFGAVHRPAQQILTNSDYIVHTEEGLCRLLSML